MNARRLAAAMGAALLVASCASSPGVRTTAREALPPAFVRNSPPAAVTALPSVAPAAWVACDVQPAPWQCATIELPLDYRRPDVAITITVAITRLPASSPADRIGSLVLNPGGPGGSGIALAWDYADLFPARLLERFDLVGFDPRGVGRSTAVDCGNLDRSFRVVERDCLARSGELLPYVGTQNAARDLEQIRKAIGDDELTYLGFSYGTALGAVYANLFPASVRALVLDGSVDPRAGAYNIDGTMVGSFGEPFYGVQDFGGTIEVFFELCDSIRDCRAGPDSAEVLDDLFWSVDEAATDHFDGWDARVTGAQTRGIVTSAMYNTDLWGPLAIALADAADGDASTLAALGSFLEAGYPRVADSFDNLLEANTAIYCADFAGRQGEFAVSGCRGWPETAEPLPPIAEVDLATPAVVIGTDGDPATPGFLAPRMAAALGDAVSVRWEGAGHTAFLHSDCIDQIVVDYLVDLVVPDNRSRCGFTDDVNTRVARARQVFRLDRERFRMRLARVLAAEGAAADEAACLADGLVEKGSDSVLVYARLGVQHPDYLSLRAILERGCSGA